MNTHDLDPWTSKEKIMLALQIAGVIATVIGAAAAFL